MLHWRWEAGPNQCYKSRAQSWPGKSEETQGGGPWEAAGVTPDGLGRKQVIPSHLGMILRAYRTEANAATNCTLTSVLTSSKFPLMLLGHHHQVPTDTHQSHYACAIVEGQNQSGSSPSWSTCLSIRQLSPVMGASRLKLPPFPQGAVKYCVTHHLYVLSTSSWKSGEDNPYPSDLSSILKLDSVQNELLDNWLNIVDKSMNLSQRVWASILTQPLSKCGWSCNFSRPILGKLGLISWKIAVSIISKYKKHCHMVL